MDQYRSVDSQRVSPRFDVAKMSEASSFNKQEFVPSLNAFIKLTLNKGEVS